MSIKKFAIAAILCTLFFSCEKVIDLDVPEGDVQLVVDGWYTDEDTSHFVKLSTTAPYFEDAPTPRVSDATVIIHTYVGETLESSEQLAEDSENPGLYEFPAPAEIGKGYQLEVHAPGFDAVMSDIQWVMEAPPILDIFWKEEDPSFQDSLAIYAVYISTFEFPGQGDFYRWFVFVDGEYQNSPQDLIVASDQLVDDAFLPEYDATGQQYREGEVVRLIQCRINESAYDYLSLLQFQTAFVGSPFDTPPAPLIGNMKFIGKEGQALGFFGASSANIAEIAVGI